MIIWLLLFALAASASAQHTRFHFGDNPKWADPAWDDSAWPQANTARDSFPVPAMDSDGMLWFRTKVAVPPAATGALAVRSTNENLVSIPDEVWVNGRLVGSHGRFPPSSETRLRASTVVFDLPPGLVTPGETALVAWRVWVPPVQRSFIEGLPRPLKLVHFEIAPADLARERERRAIAEHRFGFSLALFVFLLETVFGIAIIVLWRVVRGNPVLGYFGWFVTASGILFAWAVWPNLLRLEIPVLWYGAMLRLCNTFFGLSLISFTVRAFEVPFHRLIRWMRVSLVLAFGAWLSIECGLGPPALLDRIASAAFLSGALLQPLLAIWQSRSLPHTRGLALAMLLFQAGNAAQEFQWGGIVIVSQGFSTLAMLALMAYILLRRTWREWQIREELSAEFEAARVVQANLVPPAADLPGFRIESAYLPARQVGGDFFRILPREDGAILVVAGDVSGKGLNAAMIVATVIGALRNEMSWHPAEVLSHLNRSLLGHTAGGFVTCCCALFHPDGGTEVANAGHIAPYFGGEMPELDSGLPLGVVDGAEYGSASIQSSGRQVTFVSDGVVEASNASGELFGFDRTRSISTKSAHEIAEAARAWGQNDDITVVTVRRRRPE